MTKKAKSEEKAADIASGPAVTAFEAAAAEVAETTSRAEGKTVAEVEAAPPLERSAAVTLIERSAAVTLTETPDPDVVAQYRRALDELVARHDARLEERAAEVDALLEPMKGSGSGSVVKFEPETLEVPEVVALRGQALRLGLKLQAVEARLRELERRLLAGGDVTLTEVRELLGMVGS